MSFSSFSTSHRGQMPGHIAASGKIYFPQWPHFSRLPESFAAPSDRVFVAAMFAGLLVYLALAVVLLACGLVWLRAGTFPHRAWPAAVVPDGVA